MNMSRKGQITGVPKGIDNTLYDRDPEELRSDRTLLPDMLSNSGNLRSDMFEEE